jgi:hypothetical protein
LDDFLWDLLWGPALGTRFRGLTFRGLALWDLFYVTRFEGLAFGGIADSLWVTRFGGITLGCSVLWESL